MHLNVYNGQFSDIQNVYYEFDIERSTFRIEALTNKRMRPMVVRMDAFDVK